MFHKLDLCGLHAGLPLDSNQFYNTARTWTASAKVLQIALCISLRQPATQQPFTKGRQARSVVRRGRHLDCLNRRTAAPPSTLFGTVATVAPRPAMAPTRKPREVGSTESSLIRVTTARRIELFMAQPYRIQARAAAAFGDQPMAARPGCKSIQPGILPTLSIGPNLR